MPSKMIIAVNTVEQTDLNELLFTDAYNTFFAFVIGLASSRDIHRWPHARPKDD